MEVGDLIQLARKKVHHRDEEKVSVRTLSEGATLVKFSVLIEQDREEESEESKK